MTTCVTCGQVVGLKLGDRLIGYCGGWFGRDSYEDKTVEAIGPDWVIVRDDSGEPWCAFGDLTRLLEFRS
jgi:hypothetical protein